MKKKLILFTLIVILFTSCHKNWYVVADNEANDEHRTEGIMYSLPRTVLDVGVSMNVYHFTPGPFAAYANSYLNISGVEQMEMSFWEIDELSIHESTEPDPDASFWIIPKCKPFNVQLTDQGILSAINTSQTLEPSIFNDWFYPAKKKMPNDILFTDLGVKRNQYDEIDTIWRVIEKDSIIKRIPVYKSVERDKEWHQKAEDAANFIIKIRKRRFKLQAAIEEQQADGDGIAIMVEKLEALEREYIELFVGKTEVEKRFYHFNAVPTSENIAQAFFLAHLDIETGDIVRGKTQAYALKLKLEPFSNLNNKQVGTAKLNDVALITRQSAVANCSLILNDELLYEKRMMIPQMGVYNTLSSGLVSDDTKILVNPETGSLQMIE